ncbi:MAG: acyltransferase [Actinomycetia bacterium]|nr:acyltransferase [Actinomycetes bacterium]
MTDTTTQAIARSNTERASRPSGIPKLPYLPGLDGVRAIAVVAVLLFHLPQRVLPGGFLGVDVFFVLSGFLITSLVLGETETTQRLRFAAFYARRARRLLPALLAVLVVSGVLALTVARDAAAAFRQDVLAALSYTTNWWYIFDERSYFEALGRPPLLQHLWSLGIEEQFYLVWPAVAFFAWKQWGRAGVGVTAISGALLSTALMASLAVQGDIPASADTARLYFGADTHAMTVLVGAALAVVWRPGTLPRQIPRSAQAAVGIAGGGAILALFAIFLRTAESSGWLFRGGFLLVAIMTALLVMAASHPAARFGILLGNPVMSWLGTRSYGIYLWHWPIFMVTRPDLDIALRGWWAAAVSLGLTFGAAEASYRWLEMPIRRGALGRWRSRLNDGTARSKTEAAAVAGLAVVTVVAGAVALVAVPTIDSTTYLGGVTEFGAGELAPKADSGELGSGVSQTAQKRKKQRREVRMDALPLPQRPITAVGDSVLLGARGALRAQLPRVRVDAAISRQPVEIANRVRERIKVDRLADVLILQTGTNGPPDPQGFPDFLKELADLDLVVVPTVRSQVPWMDESNETIRRAAAGRENVVVADWARASVGHPEYLEADGTHLTPRGQEAYARLILEALRQPQQ